jgi:hypothetical protein
MKTIPLFLLGFAIPAFAGTSAKETVAPAPATEPCLFTWFVGGSVGYLTEFEEPMYNIHVGTDTCWNVGGWNVALFLELGYTEKDDDWSNVPFVPDTSNEGQFEQPEFIDLEDSSGDLDDLEDALSANAANGWGDTGYDLDIMPITFNVKLERPLTGNLNAYFGGGLGMALVDLSVDTGPASFSDDDWVFVGQVFAGLNYNFTPNCEMYGGARWIYFDDADFGGATLDLDDDFLLEIGVRYNF